jgi:hypothetical protein
MGIEKLLQTLQDRPKTADAHWAEKKQEWVEDIAALMKSIEEWLAPAVDQKLAQVERQMLELDEDDTGPYVVDALTIHLSDREVRVEPRGMRVVGVIAAGAKRVVGARGRVDLVSGPARATILRRADRTWQLATVDGWPADKGAVPLDAETLTDALAELIA